MRNGLCMLPFCIIAHSLHAYQHVAFTLRYANVLILLRTNACYYIYGIFLTILLCKGRALHHAEISTLSHSSQSYYVLFSLLYHLTCLWIDCYCLHAVIHNYYSTVYTSIFMLSNIVKHSFLIHCLPLAHIHHTWEDPFFYLPAGSSHFILVKHFMTCLSHLHCILLTYFYHFPLFFSHNSFYSLLIQKDTLPSSG